MTHLDSPRALEGSILRVMPQLAALVDRQLGEHLECQLEVADVVQEVALRALGSVARLVYRDDAATLAWLCLVARRFIVDLARSPRIRSSESESPDEVPGSKGSDPLKQLTSRDVRAQILACMAKLSLTDRSLLRARYLEGCSIVDLAQECACSNSALRVRVHRALARLKLELKRSEEVAQEPARARSLGRVRPRT